MEENLRPKDEIIKTVQELSRRLGRERVVWRYDPILLNDSYTVARHLMWFEKALAELSSYVERCVISFIDMYAKMKKNTVGLNLRALTEAEMHELATGLAERARGSGVRLQTCPEGIDLDIYDISHGACIDGELIERITGQACQSRKSQKPAPSLQLRGEL